MLIEPEEKCTLRFTVRVCVCDLHETSQWNDSEMMCVCRPSVKPGHDYERLKLQCMKAMSDLQSLQNQHTKTLKRCEEAVRDADYYQWVLIIRAFLTFMRSICSNHIETHNMSSSRPIYWLRFDIFKLPASVDKFICFAEAWKQLLFNI